MLENDLREILGNYVPRRYGDMPRNMGDYEPLVPSSAYDKVLKLKKKVIKDSWVLAFKHYFLLLI